MSASGLTAEGDAWELRIAGDVDELSTMLTVTSADGARSGGGAGGPALYAGRRLNTYEGSSSNGPRRFIARVAPDVRAVIVTLSDGTREDLALSGDPDQFGARVPVVGIPGDPAAGAGVATATAGALDFNAAGRPAAVSAT